MDGVKSVQGTHRYIKDDYIRFVFGFRIQHLLTVSHGANNLILNLQCAYDRGTHCYMTLRKQ